MIRGVTRNMCKEVVQFRRLEWVSTVIEFGAITNGSRCPYNVHQKESVADYFKLSLIVERVSPKFWKFKRINTQEGSEVQMNLDGNFGNDAFMREVNSNLTIFASLNIWAMRIRPFLTAAS